MTYISGSIKSFLRALLIVAVFTPFYADARGEERQVLIRDAEIETTLKTWLEPLARAAGIDPKGIRLVIVQSPQINAFVAGGSNIFLYTGLLEKTENPGEAIGVMAHELGHIAGGHLVAGRGAYERASYESILGAALGIGAAIVTGRGDAAIAGMGLGSQVATSNYLSHSRVQESSADQAALRFMEGSQYNPSGLRSFFEKLESEELLPASQQSPYMRTHPMTRDRIEAADTRARASPYASKAFPESWTQEHARMKAKLTGFINPGRVPWTYDDGDNSMPARYARAIAAYRENRVQEAIKDVDGLIASEPSNPFFQELKGQMLMDFGRVKEAVPYYRKAAEAVPDSGLIRIAYGHALLETGDLKGGAEQLERGLQDEPRSSEARRLLATAYGRMGQENMAKVQLAEEAVLQRRLEDAKTQAKAVLSSAPKGSREAVQAKDILNQVAILKKRED